MGDSAPDRANRRAQHVAMKPPICTYLLLSLPTGIFLVSNSFTFLHLRAIHLLLSSLPSALWPKYPSGIVDLEPRS